LINLIGPVSKESSRLLSRIPESDVYILKLVRRLELYVHYPIFKEKSTKT